MRYPRLNAQQAALRTTSLLQRVSPLHLQQYNESFFQGFGLGLAVIVTRLSAMLAITVMMLLLLLMMMKKIEDEAVEEEDDDDDHDDDDVLISVAVKMLIGQWPFTPYSDTNNLTAIKTSGSGLGLMRAIG